MPTITTYCPSDITSTGWHVRYGPRQIVLTYRSRWQGCRSGIVYTGRGDIGPVDADSIGGLVHDIEQALGDRISRGATATVDGVRWRCTDAGYVVR